MRRKFLGFIISLCCGLSVSLMAQGQDYPLDTIKGKVYYKYTAQKGEGLFRISKNFSVSQEDIIKCNPTLKNEGIKLGQVLLIPYVAKVDSSLYRIHTLQPKETLYGLSKSYGVTINEIVALNPETTKKMAIGTRLLIPAEQKQNSSSSSEQQTMPVPEPAQDTQPLIVSEDNTSGKRSDKRKQAEPIPVLPDSSITSDTILSEDLSDVSPVSTPLRIAFLLPLMTDVAPRDPSIDRFLEFYEGALLALNVAKDGGQRFEVYVYDTEKTTAKLSSILAKPEWLNMDAIIGPAYPSQVSLVSRFAYEHHIPMVVPFTNKVSDLERNPYLIQFNPSGEGENEVLIRFIEERNRPTHCVFLASEEAITKIRQLQTQLSNANIVCTQVPTRCLENDSLSFFLASDADNVLILPSDKYQDVQPLFHYLTPLQNRAGLSMLSFYAWKEQSLPLPAFYSSIFHDVKALSFENISYALNFKRYFGNDIENTLPRYDYLGYDITLYTVRLLQAKSSESPVASFEDVLYKGLQSDIHCVSIGDGGGYENRSISIQTR